MAVNSDRRVGEGRVITVRVDVSEREAFACSCAGMWTLCASPVCVGGFWGLNQPADTAVVRTVVNSL
jgi:hypothetical protein